MLYPGHAEAARVAVKTVAHLAGVAGLGALGAARLGKFRKRKGAAVLSCVAGLVVSIAGHACQERVTGTVGDGILAAGLVALAMHEYPSFFRAGGKRRKKAKR